MVPRAKTISTSGHGSAAEVGGWTNAIDNVQNPRHRADDCDPVGARCVHAGMSPRAGRCHMPEYINPSGVVFLRRRRLRVWRGCPARARQRTGDSGAERAANEGLTWDLPRHGTDCGWAARRPVRVEAQFVTPSGGARSARGCRATSEPERTTPNGPWRAKREIPIVRHCPNAAFAWRYPTRIPAAQIIRSPPTPGRAIAASADSEARARNAFTVCSRRESASVGRTPSAASGAVPESVKSALKLAVAVRPSVAGAVISPSNGMPPMGDVGRTSGGKGGTSAAPPAADSPAPELPRTESTAVASIPATSSE